MNGLALCAGIGGLELGVMLEEPEYRTVCYVEQEARILYHRIRDGALHDAPIHGDLREFDGRPWRGVDLLTAGFPCQPFSQAATVRRRGEADLWGHVLRVIGEARPRAVFLENVRGAPWEQVEQDLDGLSYDVASGLFCASELGGPTKRVRRFLLGYADTEGEPRLTLHEALARQQSLARSHGGEDGTVPLGIGDGLPGRMDRLRALGNAVIPPVAALAYRTLKGRLSR